MNTTPTNEISNDDPQRGPFWRIVGASLATGWIGVIALTLGFFAGAAEHLIMGWALLAFANGWAMLAVLTTILTNRAQRWAFVPAAFMTTTALALFIYSPGDDALTIAGWAWPPLVLALAVWIFVQLRRGLTGRVRWLLYPVVVAIALSSVGGFYETVTLSRDEDRYSVPGTLYQVGDLRLHLNCSGTGSPTVVLENGLAETSPFWSRITDQVNSTTRICAYDRAGQGWSDDAVGPQDGLAVAADLHTLLEVAGETGPFVLVGHSTGGVYSMIFAAEYPDDVVGMVLLDSATPYQFSSLPDYDSEYSMMTRVLGVLPSIARLGATQLLPASAYSSLSEPAASQVRAFATSPRQMRNVRDEQSVLREVFEQGKALDTLDDKPLVVVSATESLQDINGWTAAQARLARMSTNSEQRVVLASHEGVVDDASGYQSSAQAIIDVVRAIRTGERLTWTRLVVWACRCS